MLTIIFDLSGQELNNYAYIVDFGKSFTVPYKNAIFIDYCHCNSQHDEKYLSSSGLFVDIWLDRNLKNGFGITSGLILDENVLKTNRNLLSFYENGTLKSIYLTVPVIIMYNISYKLPISINIWPYFSFLLNSTEKGIGHLRGSGQLYSYNYSNYDYNRKFNGNAYIPIDFGVISQLNYNFMIKRYFSISFFSRLNLGLINVSQNTYLGEYIWKNYNLMFGLGLRVK